MIKLTSLSGKAVYIDNKIVMVIGKDQGSCVHLKCGVTVFVKESPEEIVDCNFWNQFEEIKPSFNGVYLVQYKSGRLAVRDWSGTFGPTEDSNINLWAEIPG